MGKTLDELVDEVASRLPEGPLEAREVAGILQVGRKAVRALTDAGWLKVERHVDWEGRRVRMYPVRALAELIVRDRLTYQVGEEVYEPSQEIDSAQEGEE